MIPAQVIRIDKSMDWWKDDRMPMDRAVVIKGKRGLPSRLMPVAEVAERLGCGIYLVYDLIRDGLIEWQPVGKRGKRISEDALLDYLERRRLEEQPGRGA